jgi:hypothetical protein
MMTIDGPDMKAILKRLPDEKDAKKAAYRAINRARTAGRTMAAKEVVRDYLFKRSDVRAVQAKEKGATMSRLEAMMSWKGTQKQLMWFEKTSPRIVMRSGRTSAPVFSQIAKRGGKTRYTKSFTGTARNGTVQVYMRKGKKRLPIRRTLGPAVSQFVGAEKVKERIINRTNEMLEKRLEHEINYILSKK